VLVCTEANDDLGPIGERRGVCGERPKLPCFITGDVYVTGGTVDVGNEVKIDTGLFGLPVQLRR
jgi:hypothetical protein